MSGINDVKYTTQAMMNKSFDDSLKVNMVEIIGKDGTLQNLAGMNIPTHDYLSLSYTGSNLTGVVYKLGGSGGATVATLTLGYDGSDNLISVTKT